MRHGGEEYHQKDSYINSQGDNRINYFIFKKELKRKIE